MWFARNVRQVRDGFFAWLLANDLPTRGFFIVCGDRHWQYHSISPEGIEEFSSGALVDANSRIGRPPGDPDSNDPEAKIRQSYTPVSNETGFRVPYMLEGFQFADWLD